MKKSKRYDTLHLIEDQPEPGSRGRVLKNNLGVTSKREMRKYEKEALMYVIAEVPVQGRS